MSKATKKKHVQKELLSRDFAVPENLNHIVQITHNSGNNLHQIAAPDGENYFVSMPGKFRNNIWIKPGDFVIVKPIEEGNKVKAEIGEILNKQYIHFLKCRNAWPFKDLANDLSSDEKQSPDKKSSNKIAGDASEGSSDESCGFGDGNLNRRRQVVEFSSSEED